MRRFIVIFALSVVFMGCSGYRVANQDNPFQVEGIKSLAIPMFINNSSIPNVSAKFTKEFTSLFASYPELELYQTENRNADALLLGIVESPKKEKDIFKRESSQLTTGDLKTSIGNRPEFFVPSSVSYKLNLRIIIIKNPRWEDIELAKSDLGKFIKGHPKIIINQNFDLQGTFNRSIKGTETPDSEGMTNFTKSKNFFEKNLESLAKTSAHNFKELVLNVF